MKRFNQLLIKHKYPLGVLLLTWGTYFTVLFSRSIALKPTGLWAGYPNVWSDWALHIGMATTFATKPANEWFAYHPIYAGGKFTYPFLANLISGLLMKIGLPLTWAFIIPSIITALVLLVGLYVLFTKLLQSRWQAVLAITIFLLAGGMGFTRFLSDPSFGTGWFDNYSAYEYYKWYTSSFIDGMLLPQRAFLLGLTVGIWALVCFIHALKINSLRFAMVGGILAGLLPVIHVHSFIAVGVMSAVFMVTHLERRWLIVTYGSWFVGLGSLFYFLFIHGGIESKSFITFLPGWTARSVMEWLKQWWLQWGIMLPLVAAGWWFMRTSSLLARSFVSGSIVIFILGNLFLFQPIHWDNTKLFLWAYVGFSGVATFVISELWRQRRHWLSVILVLVLCATGLLEAIRLQLLPLSPHLMNSTEEIALAQEIRQSTVSDARFLTAPQHNHFVTVLGARPILMGYPAWVLNYGFDYQSRERDIRTIFAARNEVTALLQHYRVSYVVIGPEEVNRMGANEDYFARHFPVAFRSDSYRIYDTRSLLTN